MKNLLKVVLVFALAAGLTACKKNVKDDANADLTAGANAGTEMVLEETSIEETVTVPAQEIALGAVYFSLDKAALSADARKIVEANAQAIKSAATLTSYRVIVEGNCDDRGTTAYNIALGQNAPKKSKPTTFAWVFRPLTLKRFLTGKKNPSARKPRNLAGLKTAARIRFLA